MDLRFRVFGANPNGLSALNNKQDLVPQPWQVKAEMKLCRIPAADANLVLTLHEEERRKLSCDPRMMAAGAGGSQKTLSMFVPTVLKVF
jgi:hypothetical protein